MIESLTLKEKKEKVANYVWSNIARASVYACWDSEKMKYGVFRGRKTPLSADGIEARYDNGEIRPTDTYILKALHCFSYAPTECITRLVEYWAEEDKQDAIVNERARRIYPDCKTKQDYFHRLEKLSLYGVVTRYDFYPEYPKVGREPGKTECLFKVNAYGIQLYKKILQDGDVSYDPRDGYSTPQDSFACCLLAVVVAPFLKSKYLKKVSFKNTVMLEKRRHKDRAEMVFNLKGKAGDAADDTEVIFEGISFRTDERFVTLEQRYDYNTERIKELYSIFMDKLEKHSTYVIFCCEDAKGIMQLVDILAANASFMLEKCLITTGNVLTTAEAIDKPEMLSSCFITLEKNEKEAFNVAGAVGYYFLEMDRR